ncbi:MAG TPA: ferric reductase-like transmembrane domain-containing protein [Solirubrobacteraceae bacterium]
MTITTQANILATAIGPHLFWITSRAAGIAALLLSSLSVCLGLLMGRSIIKGRRADMRVAHEALSLATLAAIVVHGLTLLGDGYLNPSLGDLMVPFLSGYKTFWTSIGIVSFWMLAALGLSYYARTRIGVQRWRALHRFTALAWVLGLAHSLGEGTDAGQTWFLAMTAIVAVPAIGLLVTRFSRTSEAHSATSQAAPARLPHSSRRLSGTALPPARLERP